jgi:hypothetical protein
MDWQGAGEISQVTFKEFCKRAMKVHLDSGVALPQRGKAGNAPAFARMG